MSKPKDVNSELYLSVRGKNSPYAVATTYGPFVHWQAVADWLDRHPMIRDDYAHMIHRKTDGITADHSVIRANEPYEVEHA